MDLIWIILIAFAVGAIIGALGVSVIAWPNEFGINTGPNCDGPHKIVRALDYGRYMPQGGYVNCSCLSCGRTFRVRITSVTTRKAVVKAFVTLMVGRGYVPAEDGREVFEYLPEEAVRYQGIVT